MSPLLFLLFVNYVVKCDEESNYDLVGAPGYDEPSSKPPFQVYWNVPTAQCHAKRIPFNNLYEKYGIIQNEGDSFRGENIVLMYDPGSFPALFKQDSEGNYKFRNGGVPQEGDLDVHLAAFRKELKRTIPDRNFNGLAVIDFESWRPVFRQNNGVLVPYRELSYEIEKDRHPRWSDERLLKEAKERYELAGRDFMQATLALAKELRPQAVWGYYGYPYCFNMVKAHMKQSCAARIPEENDNIDWLWAESPALYPSVYTSQKFTHKEHAQLIRGRVLEAQRLKSPETVVIPYFWFKYLEGDFLSQTDLELGLKTLYESNVDGIIIWGSSADVNTEEKCFELREYLEQLLGPAVAQYTRPASGDEGNGDDPYVSEA